MLEYWQLVEVVTDIVDEVLHETIGDGRTSDFNRTFDRGAQLLAR